MEFTGAANLIAETFYTKNKRGFLNVAKMEYYIMICGSYFAQDLIGLRPGMSKCSIK